VALLAGWALFQNLWRLGAANWMADEPVYSRAGWLYVHGSVAYNLEHPLLAKYLIGLSELLFGNTGAVAMRLPAALASLATGALLWWWVRQEADPWTALLCAGLWALLPRWVDHDFGPRVDRFALLDPFLAGFAVACLYAGWRWARTGRWRWAVATGAACALAATSKESGVVVAPAVAVGALLILRSARALAQLAAGAAAAVLVGLSTYAGAGSLHPIAYMLGYQGRHNHNGHFVAVRGVFTAMPPWWANLWFNEQAYGLLLSATLLAAVVAALVLRRDALAAWVAGGLAAFLAFYCVVSNVALPFYFDAWQPEVIMLAALGTAEVVRRARAVTLPHAVRTVAGAGAGLALVSFAVPAVSTSVAVAHLRPRGIALVPQLLDRAGVPQGRSVLVASFRFCEPGLYLAPHPLRTSVPANLATVGAIVIHKPWLGTTRDPEVVDLVAVNRSRLRHVRVDDVDVYIPTARLRPVP
jgi:4-amino-4-deoxy-L-arabinose transferase-like glycosyltransferase